MKFSQFALTKLAVAAMLPHASMAGLRGSRQMEAETSTPSQAPTSAADDSLAPSQAPDSQTDSTFDIPAMLEEIFDEYSENHEEPEYEYTEEVEDLIVLPSKESLAEDWTLFVHDGTNQMNKTVFFDEFVADVYPDTIFSEDSMDNMWYEFSKGEQFLDRENLVTEDNEITLCPEDVEPLSICLPVQMRMIEFPEPLSDEDAMQIYSDLLSDEVYHRLLNDDARLHREESIVNIDEARRDMADLGKEIDKEADKAAAKGNVELKDKLKEGSAIAIGIAERLDQCLPNDCDDPEMWLDFTFDTLLKLGPIVSKACPKCGIAMSAIGTIGKIIAIAHGGNTETTTEQYPRALTARDIERGLENALARGTSDGNEDFLVVLTASLNRSSARWGRIMTNVILPLSRSDDSKNDESLQLIDSVIDRWFAQDFEPEMDSNNNAMTGALVAHQNTFGSTTSSLRSRYNAWHNGCDSKCKFHNSETDNLIRRGLNPMRECKNEMEDANEFLDRMESMYNSLSRTFVRFNSMVDQGISIIYERDGCSEQSFIDAVEQNGSLASNHGCKYAIAVNRLIDLKERYDLYLFDLQSIYRDDYNNAVSTDDPNTCRDEGYPYYQQCNSDFNEGFGECNFGNVVMMTEKDQESRNLKAVREIWKYVHGSVTTSSRAGEFCTRRTTANTGRGHGALSESSFGGPARMGGRRRETQTFFSYVNRGNTNRLKRHTRSAEHRLVCGDMVRDVRDRGTHRTPVFAPKCKNKGQNCDIQMLAFPNMCPVQDVGTCGQRFSKDEFFKAH
ncbi:MAG: hypothetical protein SGILL_003027 [Bacillariaceae sp.]